MHNARIGAELIAICRGNESYCTLVHLVLFIEHRLRRGKPSADQSIISAGLLTGGNICAEYRNNFIIQTTDIVSRGVHRHLRLLSFMLLTVYPNGHLLNFLHGHPHLLFRVILYLERQALCGLIGIQSMLDSRIGIVLITIGRGRERYGAFIHIFRICLWLCRAKPAVDQTVELALVGRICTDNSDDIFAQSINSIGCGVVGLRHQMFTIAGKV